MRYINVVMADITVKSFVLDNNNDNCDKQTVYMTSFL